MTAPTALLDIDGTLVDSNYQHALAWYRAFRLHGLTIPVWRCHRAIGMGGDQLVRYLAGDGFEERAGRRSCGSRRRRCSRRWSTRCSRSTARAALIEDLKGRGCKVVMASSAKPKDTQHFLDLLDARALVDGWTDSGDVEATKPAPDLIQAALRAAGTAARAVLIGDSTWDCRGGEGERSGRSPCAPAASASTSCSTPARSPSTTRSPSCARSLSRRPSASSAARAPAAVALVARKFG